MQFLSMLILVPLAAIGILAGACSVLYFGKIAVAAIADTEFRDINGIPDGCLHSTRLVPLPSVLSCLRRACGISVPFSVSCDIIDIMIKR